MLYNSKFPVLSHAKLPKNWYRIPFYSNALYNNVFVRIWIFLSTSFDKQVSESFEPLERFVYSSEKLCARV